MTFLKKVTVFDFSHFLTFRRISVFGGVFSKNLTLFFAFLAKSAFFDHFCKNRRIRQKRDFGPFWAFSQKCHFLMILGVPDDSGLIFSDFLVFRGGEPRFLSQIIGSRGPIHQIWTIQGSRKVTFLTKK